MRTYYVFYINDILCNLYKNKEYVLYNMLEELYKMKRNDIVFCYKFFKEVAYSFNKIQYNEYIFNELSNTTTYMKNINTHIINDKFSGEKTYLTVYNSHIKIKTNNDLTVFFSILNKLNKNLFICDFINYDYFFLNTCIKNDFLVECL